MLNFNFLRLLNTSDFDSVLTRLYIVQYTTHATCSLNSSKNSTSRNKQQLNRRRKPFHFVFTFMLHVVHQKNEERSELWGEGFTAFSPSVSSILICFHMHTSRISYSHFKFHVYIFCVDLVYNFFLLSAPLLDSIPFCLSHVRLLSHSDEAAAAAARVDGFWLMFVVCI